MHRTIVCCAAAWLFTASAGWGALTPEQAKALPPPAGHAVNFAVEIKPIFEASCIRCHGRGRDKGGLQIDSRQSLLKGGDSGPAAISGNSAGSLIVEVVSGLNPDEVMPKKGKKLTPAEVGALRAWIDQGLPWDPEISFGPVPPQNLDPRLPAVPIANNESNPADRFLDVYFQKHHIKPQRPVDDRVFARRVYLDTIGLLPSPKELDAFEASRKPGKRETLVQTLLARGDSYAQNWLTFWNDLLRNDYKGTGYIDGGREQITKWLYTALATNMPYDQFVAQLINPNAGSAGFSKGIVWRGFVNASQMPQMQMAQNFSQVFMGVNLKCASCHDSFINDWQLSDSYGLANVFSDHPLEIYRCDVPTGKQAPVKFLFPQLGELPPAADKKERLKALASMVTCPKDGRLSRTIVNRLWAKFLGRGLVDPVDDMQQTAWDRDLLDWLAQDLVQHNYDLRKTMERILTSRAYQLPAVDLGEQPATNYVFAGPSIRRMTAEEFRDALTTLTGAGYAAPDAQVDLGESVVKKFGLKLKAKWVWNDPHAAKSAKAGTIYLRKSLRLAAPPQSADALVYCDNAFSLYVNGHQAGSGADFAKGFMVDLKPWLKTGSNVIAVQAINAPATTRDNPAGLYIYARIRSTTDDGENVADFITDKSWLVTEKQSDGWEKPDFDAHGWTPASELGQGGAAPWRLPGDEVARQFASHAEGGVRASLVVADPLMVALGRPNREQVVTTRATEATTLQALELTNGKTLADILSHGAANLIQQHSDGPDLIRSVYEQAVGRRPTSQELKLAKSLVGKKPAPDGVEDFVWAVAMLPEFQLIY